MKPVQGPKAALTRGRALMWKLRRSTGDTPGLRVLLYHRVADDKDALALHPRRFVRQMEHLARRATPQPTSRPRSTCSTPASSSRSDLAITFDDGFLDLQENALGVLEKFGFTSTVFVSTEVIDGTARYWWAPDDAKLLELGRAARARRRRNHEDRGAQPHASEPDPAGVRGLPAGDQGVEGRPRSPDRPRVPASSATPAASSSLRERDLARDAGFRYGITCEPGLNLPDTDPHLIPRIQIDKTDSVGDFAAKIRGSHDRPLPGRAQYRRYKYGF